MNVAANDASTPRECVFGISRRFQVPEVDELTRSIIEPILLEHGLPLTCFYASNNAENPDHWVNRMGFIFDLSDAHVVIDIDRSGNTLYEYEASNLANFSMESSFFHWILGLRCAQKIQSFRIIVHDQPGRYKARSPSYFSDPLKVRASSFTGSTLLVRYDRAVPDAFRDAFSRAVATVVSAVLCQEQRAREWEKHGTIRQMLNPMFFDPQEGEQVLPVDQYAAIRLAIARRVSENKNISPIDISREIARYGDAPELPTLVEMPDGDFVYNPKLFVHDSEAMAEHAALAVDLGRRAAAAMANRDDVQVRQDLLAAAMALRFSLLASRSNWRSADFDAMHQRLTAGKVRRALLRVMARAMGPL